MDSKSCEVLEAVLSRMQMATLDLQRTNLEDEVSMQCRICDQREREREREIFSHLLPCREPLLCVR